MCSKLCDYILISVRISSSLKMITLGKYSSFSQLGNSGNSAISVKGKGLTKAKIYLKRKDSSKIKI